MGNAGNASLFRLDPALEKGQLAPAWFAARESAYVTLDQALRLTILMAGEEASKYDRCARRFLIRFVREVEPTLEQIQAVADALNVLGEPESFASLGARKAMVDLARQLTDRR